MGDLVSRYKYSQVEIGKSYKSDLCSDEGGRQLVAHHLLHIGLP